MSCPKHDDKDKEEIISLTKLNLDTNQQKYESVFDIQRVLVTVLEQLASGEDLENLKTFRTVSRKWNLEAKKCLQNINWKYRKFLNIMNANKLQKYFDTFLLASDPDPDQMLFSCFRIDPQSICCELNPELVDRFFQTFGPGIKSLSLEQTSSSSVSDSVKINNFQVWLSNMSRSLEELNILIPQQLTNPEADAISLRPMEFELRLNYLCLTLPDYYSDVPVVQHLIFLEMILAKIKVSTRRVKICLLQWQDIGKTITLLEKINHLKNLKVLDIKVKDPKDGDMKVLNAAGTEFQLRLKFLRISDDSHHYVDFDFSRRNERFVTTEEIYKFLCIQGDTLEMLDWSGKYFKFPVPPQGMKGLKKLRLRWKDNALDSRVYQSETDIQAKVGFLETCPPIDYSNLFPHLEELQLTSFAFNVGFSAQFLRPQLPCHTVRRLGIRCLSMDVGFLQLVSKMFPSITAFEIQMDSFFLKDKDEDFFSALWGKGTRFADTLEELVIEMNYYDKVNPITRLYKLDSIFSGVDPEDIDYEFDFFEEGGWDTTKTYPHKPRPTGPSIFQLKNLRKLTISGAHQFQMAASHHDGFFSDFSAYCVFGSMEMEKLEWLHIEEGIHRFSKPALDYLKTKLQRSGRMEPGFSTSTATGENRVEEIFHSAFTHMKNVAVKRFNLIDTNLPIVPILPLEDDH